MKNKGLKIASFSVMALCCLMVFIAVVVPFIKVATSTTSSTNTYFHTLFSASITSSSSVKAVSFGSVLVLILFLLAPIGLILENKIVKAVGFAIDLSMVSVSVYFLQVVSDLKKALGTSTTEVITAPGVIILLVASIVLVLYGIFDIVMTFFGDKIAEALRSSSKSPKVLLDENEELFKAGYISEAERDARKAKILEGK